MADFREYHAAFVQHQNDISHHGILGMHWGIRRFQDKDGSLTAAGRERYGVEDAELGKKRDYESDYKVTDQDIWDIGNAEKFWAGTPGYDMNCPNCSLSVELKKRGIDVTPRPDYDGQSVSQVLDVSKGEKTTFFEKLPIKKGQWTEGNTTYEFNYYDMSDAVKKSAGPPGSHGYLAGQYPNDGGGHIMNYTVLEDGSIQVEDAQSGMVMSIEEASMYYCFEYGWVIDMSNAEIDLDKADKLDMVTPKTTADQEKYEAYRQANRSALRKLWEFIKGIFT